MTGYEIVSIIISCIALAASIWISFAQRRASVAQRKLQSEANDLQRAISELAKKQLEILLRDEAGKHMARVSLDLAREGRDYRFYIRNLGTEEARDVAMELLVEPKNSPIIQSEYDEKFPVKRLQPGSSVSLIAALHLGSPMAYNAKMSWTNPDGSRVEEEMYTAL
jgi:hypothetical protein